MRNLRWVLVWWVALAAPLVWPAPVAGQDLQALAGRCVSSGATQARCAELAVTARSLQGHVGLLGGLGSEVSGSAGTLGRRLGTTPRVSVGARAAFASVHLPDLADQGSEPSREAGFVVPAIHLGAAAGVFDGFSLAPTVGGFLSVDLLAQTSVLFLPTGEGFEGRTTGFSLGARLGLLRESFTLPGVAVSVSRRSMGAVRYGDAGGPGGGAVEVDPTVTSLRATVGKDVLSVGIVAGMGWDSYSGSATIRAATEGAVVTEADSDFGHSRTLIFGGAALNFLILQLSAEAGWARGFEPVPSYGPGPFDPAGGTLYASVAFRVTI